MRNVERQIRRNIVYSGFTVSGSLRLAAGGTRNPTGGTRVNRSALRRYISSPAVSLVEWFGAGLRTVDVRPRRDADAAAGSPQPPHRR
jgi:hypothetical protein